MNITLLQYMPRDPSDATEGRTSGKIKPFGAPVPFAVKLLEPGFLPAEYVPEATLLAIIPISGSSGMGIPLPLNPGADFKAKRMYIKGIIRASIRAAARTVNDSAKVSLDKVLAGHGSFKD